MLVLSRRVLLKPSTLAVAALLAVGCRRTAATPPDAASVEVAASPGLPARAERPMAPAGFEGATGWLNVTRPLAGDELRGRVVVVDFWTSGCINCLHTLPVLAALEKKHADRGLVVVGVHSAKFDPEADNERLRAALVESSVTQGRRGRVRSPRRTEGDPSR